MNLGPTPSLPAQVLAGGNRSASWRIGPNPSPVALYVGIAQTLCIYNCLKQNISLLPLSKKHILRDIILYKKIMTSRKYRSHVSDWIVSVENLKREFDKLQEFVRDITLPQTPLFLSWIKKGATGETQRSPIVFHATPDLTFKRFSMERDSIGVHFG
jgi:hypothetical protein